LRIPAKLFIEFPIYGWFGKRLALLKFSVSLKSSSDYLSRFRLWRTSAKPFIEVPMSGWFGKRFALLKFIASLKSSSAYLSRFRL
jgi:hypothetical protein